MQNFYYKASLVASSICFVFLFLHVPVVCASDLDLSLDSSDKENIKSYLCLVSKSLIKSVPGIISKQNASTGRYEFTSSTWSPRNQSLIFPLAVVWANKSDTNPYYKDQILLNSIINGAKALISNQDSIGMLDLVGNDGKNWGKIFDPWIYLHWIRTYSLVKASLPADTELKWRNALTVGFNEIANNILPNAAIYNIPVTQAVALYVAGKSFNRTDWQTKAKSFITRTIAAQSTDGYWSEHAGPVLNYGFIYVQSLGIYYALSKDPNALIALKRAASFYTSFTYPDRTNVETIDERNFYDPKINEGNIGFIFTYQGRSFLYNQYLQKKYIYYYNAADILLYADKVDDLVDASNDIGVVNHLVTTDNLAEIERSGSWFFVSSAYTAPLSISRWILDRQNFISIFHKKKGLVIGGGNTKLQPLWSTFIVGDPNLMKYENVENPNFTEPSGLIHIPDKAELLPHGEFGVRLVYGSNVCTVRKLIIDDNTMNVEFARLTSDKMPMEAHVTIIPQLGLPLRSQDGKEMILSAEPFLWNAAHTSYVELNGVRYHIPSNATIQWPVYPYNQYAKNGQASLADARIVITLPLGTGTNLQQIKVDVLDTQEGTSRK